MIRPSGLKLGRAAAIVAFLASVPAEAANQAPIPNAGPDRTGTVNVALILSAAGSFDPDGTIAAYWWQFGDGSSITTSSPSVSHVWRQTGVFTVTLWVRDAAWKWSAAADTARVTIGTGTAATTTTTTSPVTTTTVGTNRVPTAEAGPNQATQTLVKLSFNGSASRDPDGTIAMASWTFGDGTSAAGLVVTHAYATPGTYTATLSVLDNRGALDTDTATITVANRSPTANAGPDVSGTPGGAVVLNGAGSSDADGTITGWAWTFGDGTSGTGVNPSHAYAAAGSYTATLTVTDNKGARASDSAVVTVAGSVGGGGPWARKIGSTSSDGAYTVWGDAAGNTVVGGSLRGSANLGGTTISSVGGADGYVIKYASTGAVVWARAFGGSSDDAVEGVTVDKNGDVVVAARFAGTASFGGTALVASGPSDIAIAKYSGANGAHQWSKRFGGTYDDSPAAIAVDPANNIYFTGYFRGTVSFGGPTLSVPFTSDLDVFVAKLGPTGAYVWAKNFPNDGNERGYGIAVDGSGNVAVTGSFSNSVNFGGGSLTSVNAMTDGFVVRLTTNGAHTWSRRFGAGDGNESGYGAAVDSSGNVVIAGSVTKPVDFGGGLLSALGNADGFVAKYAAASGSHMWSRRLGGTGNDYAYGVAVDGASNIFVAGAFGGLASFGGASLPLLGSSDAFVAKYGSSGSPVWARGLGGLDAEVGRSIGVAGGNAVTAGYFSGSGSFSGTTLVSSGMSDGFVARLAP